MRAQHWPQAMFTGPTEALPQNLAPGLIMAGDHNGLGMEPTAISGCHLLLDAGLF